MNSAGEADFLLPILNRRQFDADLAKATTPAEIHSLPLTMILVDLDNFKNVNDTYGHPVGDAVLKKCADILGTCVGNRGKCYRYGGEEMAVLLPNFTAGEGRAVAERLRTQIAETRFEEVCEGITASFGVGELAENAVSGEELVKSTDAALYSAKENGRNQVVVAKSMSEVATGRTRDEVAVCASITNGSSQSFTISVKNEGEIAIALTKIEIFDADSRIRVARYIRPEDAELPIGAKQEVAIGWNTQPDIVAQLSRIHDVGIVFEARVDIAISARVFGKVKEFHHVVLTRGDFSSHSLVQLAG